jgi:hypothetical protein
MVQQAIRQFTDEKWPDGWDHISTSHIMKVIGKVLEARDIPVPGRDTFVRALDRREG